MSLDRCADDGSRPTWRSIGPPIGIALSRRLTVTWHPNIITITKSIGGSHLVVAWRERVTGGSRVLGLMMDGRRLLTSRRCCVPLKSILLARLVVVPSIICLKIPRIDLATVKNKTRFPAEPPPAPPSFSPLSPISKYSWWSMKANLLVVYWMRAIFVTTAAAAPTWQPGRRHLAPKNSISGFPNFGFSNLLFRFTSADRTHTWPSSLPALFFIFIWNNRFLDSFLRSIVRDARPFFVSKGNVEFPFLFSRFFFFISFCTVECIFIRSRMIESSWVAGDRGSNLKRCYISLSLYVCLDQSGLLISCVCVCVSGSWCHIRYTDAQDGVCWSIKVDGQYRRIIPHSSRIEKGETAGHIWLPFIADQQLPFQIGFTYLLVIALQPGWVFFYWSDLRDWPHPRDFVSPQQIWFICLMTFFFFLSQEFGCNSMRVAIVRAVLGQHEHAQQRRRRWRQRRQQFQQQPRQQQQQQYEYGGDGRHQQQRWRWRWHSSFFSLCCRRRRQKTAQIRHEAPLADQQVSERETTPGAGKNKQAFRRTRQLLLKATLSPSWQRRTRALLLLTRCVLSNQNPRLLGCYASSNTALHFRRYKPLKSLSFSLSLYWFAYRFSPTRLDPAERMWLDCAQNK